jgi:hypothetical protein
MIVKSITFWSSEQNTTLIVEVRRQPNGRFALETFANRGHPLGPDLLESVKDMTKRDALAQVNRWERAYC